MRGQYEFDPAAAELDFGGKDSRATAGKLIWTADTSSRCKAGLTAWICGAIAAHGATSALAVVMDYKSGGKKWDALLVEHGVQLQLPAYLNALRHWKNPREIFGVDRLVPAGVFFVNLRGQFEGGRTRDEVLGAADARKLAYRHHGRFDAGRAAATRPRRGRRPVQLPAEPGRLAPQRFDRGAAARRV